MLWIGCYGPASFTLHPLPSHWIMKLLILGGTRFIGRHLTETALAAGHEVSLFNRNRHEAGLFPEVEALVGDRLGDLSALEGRSWDAVIDTSAYTPDAARRSTDLLRKAAYHYIHFHLDGFGLPGLYTIRDERGRAGRHHNG